jgi:hypothetical protein
MSDSLLQKAQYIEGESSAALMGNLEFARALTSLPVENAKGLLKPIVQRMVNDHTFVNTAARYDRSGNLTELIITPLNNKETHKYESIDIKFETPGPNGKFAENQSPGKVTVHSKQFGDVTYQTKKI